MIDQLLYRFPVLNEDQVIFPNWFNLVTTNKVMGKRTHDVRIIAAMLSHEITHLLIFNPRDFTGLSNITIVHPQDLTALNVQDS